MVSLVSKGAENCALLHAAVAQQRQGLIGMTRHHDVIEHGLLRNLTAQRKHDMVGRAANGSHGCPQVNVVGKATGERRNVGTRSALNHSPRGSVSDVQHSVVVKEPYEISKRKMQHLLFRCRPDRRPHRDDVVVLKRLGVMTLLEILTQSECVIRG